jgi:hypothetical protein
MGEPKAELPAVNWLVYVLNRFEFPGTQIKLGDEHGCKGHSIQFSDEQIKNIFIGMAQIYKQQEDKLYRLSSELGSIPWHPVSEMPDGPLSACRRRTVLVTSPALQYVTPVALGCHDNVEGQWYVYINGKVIPHNVTHWRHLPAAPQAAPPYDAIKDEVEKLRELMKDG